MNCNVADIIEAVEELAPPELAQDWDNVGLQVGQKNWPVNLVWVALDPLPEVVSSAAEKGVDLIVTHHPLIFKPLKAIDIKTAEGYVIQTALLNQIAIYAAHTNLDAADDGVNDTLAARIDMQDLTMLTREATGSAPGLGRIGVLKQETQLASLAEELRKELNLSSVRIAGNRRLHIHKAAVCAGSGSGLVDAFLASDADVFISGDLKYHDARAIEFAAKGLIDIGHFASEYLVVETFAQRLKDRLMVAGRMVRVEPCKLEKDPFVII
jgi:dinuclear metal center YbgI/SA1388 family protein